MTSESTSHDCTRPIQVTEDLRIRPYNEEDIDDLYPRLLAEQDELFMIGSIAGMKSVNDLHLEIDRVNALLRTSNRLGGAIELRGRIVGSARISHIVLGEEGDFGYWLFKEARGQGLVTQCGRTLIDTAFRKLDLTSVTVLAATQNRASCAVATRLGMTLDEVRPEWLHRSGRAYDATRYRVNREDWV